MTRFLLDTNCISELVRPIPARGVVNWISSVEDEWLYLSVLTLGEIRKGVASLPSSKRRMELETWLESGLKQRFAGRILPIDEAVAEQWGIISARAKSIGKPLATIDGLIAATALQYGLTIVTRNVDDFLNTKALVINPWH